jgi:hypothetical protein
MDREFPHDFRVVAIDETHNWDEAITAITGRIAGIYLIDFGTVTHLCSLDGSYWAEFVCNVPEHYIREPDGYDGGKPIWDDEWAAEHPEDFARSKALVEAWNGPFYGLTYEGGNESSHYISERATFRKRSEPMDGIDPDSDDPARDAMEGVQEHMANGEEWEDLLPWKE